MAGTWVDFAGGELTVYIPAYDRHHGITGTALRGNFVGSDLTYEDLALTGLLTFTLPPGDHELVPSPADWWIIDTWLLDSPQYSRVRSAVFRTAGRVSSYELFDYDDQPAKSIFVTDDGVHVWNLRRGTRTTIGAPRVFQDIESVVLHTWTPLGGERRPLPVDTVGRCLEEGTTAIAPEASDPKLLDVAMLLQVKDRAGERMFERTTRSNFKGNKGLYYANDCLGDLLPP